MVHPPVPPRLAHVQSWAACGAAGVEPVTAPKYFKKVHCDSFRKDVYKCQPCEKNFPLKSQYDAHVATHEECHFDGCSFTASKKVISAHYHSTHGVYSGSGLKIVAVEGQSFKVLMGTDPKEVEQWRAERRRRFPTKASHGAKSKVNSILEISGGVLPKALEQTWKLAEHDDADGVNMTPSSAADSLLSSNDKKPCFLFLKSKCSKGDSCRYSPAYTLNFSSTLQFLSL